MPEQGRSERLGVLGGTFDPPHHGHVAAARACVEQLALDRLLFVVANDPWQKSPLRSVTPARHRLAMVEAVVGSIPRAEVSRIELERGGPSYTVDTVEALAADARDRGHPDPELFLIVGADVVPSLASWHRVGDLARLVTLVVVPRPGAPAPEALAGWRLQTVACEEVAVSSSQVREAVRTHRPLRDLVPEPVERYIRTHSLYAVPR
jgi:nicotinate-nucleotide adenylyltransferase